MKAWNDLLNTAMLGTDKTGTANLQLPEAIVAQLPPTGDAETDLLRQIAAMSVYRRSGRVPRRAEATIGQAPPEDRPYCNAAAEAALRSTLDIDNLPLLKRWLRGCEAAGAIAPPDYLDELLELAARHKALRPAVLGCGGERAAWLCGLNPAWNFAVNSSDEEAVWSTGTPEQRQAFFRAARHTDPEAALHLLQESWPGEDAASKAAFLGIVAEHPTDDDLPFLEGLAAEKGKKVKETLRLALQKIPGSALVQRYWDAVKEAMTLRREKILLGLRSRTVLHIGLPQPVPEAVFEHGIDRVSPVKGLSDEDFVLGQLIASVPPSRWPDRLELTAEEIVGLLQQEPSGRVLLRGLASAAGRFGDRQWARALARDENAFYRDLLPLLDGEAKNAYLLRRFSEDAEEGIASLLAHTDEAAVWPEPLAAAFLQATATSPYQYNRAFYSLHAQHLPTAVLDALESFRPPEAYYAGMWSSYSNHIRELVQLRDSILQAFPHNSNPQR